MQELILIVASSGGGLNPRGGVEVYVPASLEEAERFVALWDESQMNYVEGAGGYPGYAYIISDGLPAAEWIAKEEAWLAEQAEEDEEDIVAKVTRLLAEQPQ